MAIAIKYTPESATRHREREAAQAAAEQARKDEPNPLRRFVVAHDLQVRWFVVVQRRRKGQRAWERIGYL